MVGRDLDHRFPAHEPTIGEEIFRIEDWTVHHPTQHERVVVKGANLSVRAGEIVGLAGLMGAGRTELAMSVFGRTYGHGISGRIYKDGQEIKVRTVARRDPSRHRLRHRGPQALRAEPHRGHQAQHLRRRAGQALPPWLGQRQRGVQGRRRVPREHEHQGAERGVASPASSAAATSRRSC